MRTLQRLSAIMAFQTRDSGKSSKEFYIRGTMACYNRRNLIAPTCIGESPVRRIAGIYR